MFNRLKILSLSSTFQQYISFIFIYSRLFSQSNSLALISNWINIKSLHINHPRRLRHLIILLLFNIHSLYAWESNLMLMGNNRSINITKQTGTLNYYQTSNVITSEAYRIVQGRILNKITGLPIPNSTVESDTGEKIQTDSLGNFAFAISKLATHLLISNVGYTSQKVGITDYMIVYLTQEHQEIQEVLVETGILKKIDKSFTGSFSSYSKTELMTFGDRNIVSSLLNIDPTLHLIENNSNGSNPNQLPQLQIRGNSNIPNIEEIHSNSHIALNTPLIILDGFQSNLQKLMDMNENQVESITILKDAAATALYGSRGANGVIVITSHTPAKGKLRVNFSTNWNIESPDLSTYSLLSARKKLELERIAGYYNNPRAEIDITLKKYYNFILNEINRGVETNWLAIPIRNGLGQRHHLSLEGGDNKLRYTASVQNNNIQGVMKGSFRNTINGNITLHYNLPNVRFKNNTQIQNTQAEESPYGSFSEYVRLNPYWTPFDNQGNIVKQLGNPGDNNYQYYWSAGLPTNPLYNATLKTYNRNSLFEVLNNTSIEWNIARHLAAKGQLGVTKNINQSDNFRPADHTAFARYDLANQLRKGDYTDGFGSYFSYDGAIELLYAQSFRDKHQIFTGVNANIRHYQEEYHKYVVEGFPNADLDFPAMGLQYLKDAKPTGAESTTRAVGLTVNGNYAYNGQYFIDGTWRTDGSSQYGAQNRFATFWSLGLGWNVHHENFMQYQDFINHLKIRGSVGSTGSQNFQAYQALTSYLYNTESSYYTWVGANPIAIGNEHLKWQSTLKRNIGFDLEVLQSKLVIKADVYRERTKDLISSMTLPGSNGFPSYLANIGSLENRGVELNISTKVFNKLPHYSWTISTALVHNKNKIIQTSKALQNAQQQILNGNFDPGILYIQGYSSRTLWVVRSLGIDPSTGKELYLSKDGEPTFTWNSADIVPVGSEDPLLYGNLNSSLRLKNIILNLSLRYEFGGQLYNATLRDKVETSSYKYNVDTRVYDSRWKEPGDQVAFKSLHVLTPTYKTSRFVQDYNTLMLSNIQIQYLLHNYDWIKNCGFQSLHIIANSTDPLQLSSIRRERGIDYPFARRISLSLKADF